MWAIALSVSAVTASARQSPDYDPEHVLVRFKPGVTGDGIAAAHRAANTKGTLRRYRSVDGLMLMKVSTGTVKRAIAAYRRNPNVIYAEPDYRVHAFVTPNDPGFPTMWDLQNTGQTVNGVPGTPGSDIHAVPAWDLTTGSSDIVVAVIDTGVDYTHPDLVGNLGPFPLELPGNHLDDDGNGWIDDVYGVDFVNHDSDPMDDEGHGTHVSGTIAARGNNGLGVTGVSWHSKIVALKFLDDTGYGDTSDAVAALDYAVANGIRISNNSWGGSGYSQAMYDAIAASQSIGHLFVAAAGNDGSNNDVVSDYPSGYALSNIISVAATNNIDELASFSNFGFTTVDLAAPGVGVYSTLPGNSYGLANGTSMATPHVTGAVALLMSYAPALSWSEVRDRILNTVRPVKTLDGWVATGGVLNVAAALGDCNGNGVDDLTDIANHTSEDCSGNGIPDECEADCNGNGIADSCDIATGGFADCESNGIPDVCEPDCDGNGVVDGCELANGLATDCNEDGVIDICESDFDQDGTIDGCDPDIDNDGVLNEADVCDYTPSGVPVYPGQGSPVGDLNQNCTLDHEDYFNFWNCLFDGGPDRYVEDRLCRNSFDYDGAGTVDLKDLSTFFNGFAGP